MKNKYIKRTIEIDLREVCWKLLEQWKAVLLTAVIMAVLVCGAKYSKDMKAYNANMAAQKEKAEQASIPAEERIEKIMAALPESEKSMVTYLVREQAWVDSQKDYLRDSILIQTDPTNQRVLKLVYDIDTESNEEEALLVNSYYAHLKSDAAAEAVKPFISPDSENRYISELFYREEEELGTTPALNSEDSLIVNIVLEETTDADAVSAGIKKELSAYSAELNAKYKHDLKLAEEETTHLYHKANVAYRMDMFENVNDLEVSINNKQSYLSAGQKAAISAIVAINRESAALQAAESADNGSSPESTVIAPSWSKKYAVLGFIIGVIAYAFIYCVLLILKGGVTSAANLVHYTGMRPLGEVYYTEDRKGLKKLLQSEAVRKIRFGDRLDIEKQIEKFTASLAAVCEHAGDSSAALLNYTSKDGKSADIMNRITALCANKGLSVKTIDMSDGFDEKSLLDIKHAVFAVSEGTKVSELTKMQALCSDYGIDVLGSCYTAG